MYPSGPPSAVTVTDRDSVVYPRFSQTINTALFEPDPNYDLHPIGQDQKHFSAAKQFLAGITAELG